VLVGAIISIRILGKLVEKSIELMMLGLVNRVAGIFVFLFIYLALYSILLVYLKRFGWMGNETVIDSKSFSSIALFSGNGASLCSSS
jgi:hypothetical protein